MSILGFLVLLIVAAICGSIGSGLAGGNKHGCFTNIILGFIGALIGTFLSRELGVHDFLYIKNIPVIWSIVGSALFVWLIINVRGKSINK